MPIDTPHPVAKWLHKATTVALVVIVGGAIVLLTMTVLGWLVSFIIPGCIVGEDGGNGCIALGINFNSAIFFLGVAGMISLIAWCLYFSIPCLLIYWLRAHLENSYPSFKRDALKRAP